MAATFRHLIPSMDAVGPGVYKQHIALHARSVQYQRIDRNYNID